MTSSLVDRVRERLAAQTSGALHPNAVAAAIRAESTTFVRTAVGTPDNFVFIEDKESSLTAENYLAALRYDRKVSDFLFWYGGASWERNRFAGVENAVKTASSPSVAVASIC